MKKTSFVDLPDWRQTRCRSLVVFRLSGMISIFLEFPVFLRCAAFIGVPAIAAELLLRCLSLFRGEDSRSSPSSSFPLNAAHHTDPLNRRERADVSPQLAATASLDLSSAALHSVICSLQDAGARAAFCSGPTVEREGFPAGATNEQGRRRGVQQRCTSSRHANYFREKNVV